MDTIRLTRSAAFIGPLVAIGMGAATASVRDEVGSTIVGVALATVVTVAALIGRAAALTTAAVAASTFNFFHTEPYHSLRIHDPGDVVIVALLLGLGVAISDVTGWTRRANESHDSTRSPKAPRDPSCPSSGWTDRS